VREKRRSEEHGGEGEEEEGRTYEVPPVVGRTSRTTTWKLAS
jgi:hypothetical protein